MKHLSFKIIVAALSVLTLARAQESDGVKICDDAAKKVFDECFNNRPNKGFTVKARTECMKRSQEAKQSCTSAEIPGGAQPDANQSNAAKQPNQRCTTEGNKAHAECMKARFDSNKAEAEDCEAKKTEATKNCLANAQQENTQQENPQQENPQQENPQQEKPQQENTQQEGTKGCLAKRQKRNTQ